MKTYKTKAEAITAITRMYMEHIGMFNIKPEDYTYSSITSKQRNIQDMFIKFEAFEGNISDTLDNNDYTKRVFVACHDKTCAILAMDDENYTDNDYNTFCYLSKKPDTFYMCYDPKDNKVNTVSADHIKEVLNLCCALVA